MYMLFINKIVYIVLSTIWTFQVYMCYNMSLV